MAKYPRTPHLPYSPGATKDDKRLQSVTHFLNQHVVLTEKMDGSNVCLERGAVFARSHSGAPKHPSFDALKQLHGQIRHLIHADEQLFGEWCYARHSIAYTELPGYLMLFGIRTETIDAGTIETRWKDWHSVKMRAHAIGVPTVPELEIFSCPGVERVLQERVERHAARPSECGGEREGVVVRLLSGFRDEDFPLSVAKHVRANHVQTDDHWSSQAIVKNGLKT